MTTTPTHTSGAAIQRYKIGYHSDDWGQRSSTPSGIPDASGSWVRYADHIAALAAGQATAAQAVVQDDLITLRKPTTSAELLWLLKLAQLVISDVDKTLEETFALAQPAEQGAAYAALPDLIHVDGEIWSAILDWKHAKRGEDALRKADVLERVLSDQMRTFADATCALRASRGQASAGAGEPTEQQILEAAFAPAQPAVEASRFGSPELQAMIVARCVEKDQADSVREDAACWQWLAEYLVGTRTDLDDEIVASETVNDLRKLVGAAIKQGATQ